METTDEQTATVKKSQEANLIIYYGASWCGPCKAMAPTLNQLEGVINILKVDIDDCPTLTQDAGIRAVPTLIQYKNGLEVNRIVGGKSKDEIVKLYNS
jgi:thioredoxin 1